MTLFLLKRLLSALLVIWAVTTVTFVSIHLIPGDPFADAQYLPAPVYHNIRQHYGLDQPLLVQYFRYLSGIAHADLGQSLRHGDRSVNDIIARNFPVSASLGMVSLILAITAGLSLGTIAALNNGKLLSGIVSGFSVLGLAVPNFILALVLIYIFAEKLNLLPAALWQGWQSAILPAVSLAAAPTAYIARLTRSSLTGVMRQNFVKVSRSFGFSRTRIIFFQALPVAIIPVLAFVGPLSSAVLTGSFAVENIFAVPGLGKYFVSSIYDRDYTVVAGLTLFYSSVLVSINLVVDLVCCLIDPRTRPTTMADGGWR
ncbi:MAG: ABC transporter permease [Negativicutes bacterium]|nr:ABC transporter permease [Negativicutes bacterium]